MICGTSGGAVYAALVCTHARDELRAQLRADVLPSLLPSFTEPALTVLRAAACEAELPAPPEPLAWWLLSFQGSGTCGSGRRSTATCTRHAGSVHAAPTRMVL